MTALHGAMELSLRFDGGAGVDRRTEGKVVALLRLFWVEVLAQTLASILTLIPEEKVEEGKDEGEGDGDKGNGKKWR